MSTIVLAVVLLRARLLSFPLERDEGAFAYMAQLLLNGIPLYTQAYDFKPPGLYVMYAAFIGLFGASAAGIHLGLLFSNVASILLLFLIAKRILGIPAALAAAASFAFLSLAPSMLGFAAHATHFVVLAALAGVLLLLIALENHRPAAVFWSGALFAISFLMKQPGLIFPAFGAIILVHHAVLDPRTGVKTTAVRLLLFAAGVLTPMLITVTLLWLAGSLGAFWFWNVTYASNYGTSVPPLEGLAFLVETLPYRMDGYHGIWAMAGAGLVLACFYRPLRHWRAFLLLYFAACFAATCSGFYFREHYFIVLLPALSLLCGVTVRCLYDRFSAARGGVIPTVLVITAIGLGLLSRTDYYFTASPTALSRGVYGNNPFPEAAVVAKLIEQRTQPDDRIAILGSEPEIYFYSNRRSASPFIFTYPMAELHEYARTMQQQMIEAVTASPPKYLIYVNIQTSWLLRPGSDRMIFEWLDQYTKEKYEIEGIVHIQPAQTSYYWDEQARAVAENDGLINEPILVVYRRGTADA